MKMKLINKIWKFAFVLSMTSVGFGLSGCSNKEDKNIAALTTSLNNFYKIEKERIYEWNYSISEPTKLGGSIKFISASIEQNANLIPGMIADNRLGQLNMSINWSVTGFQHLTGDAKKDYSIIQIGTTFIFQQIQKSYNSILGELEKMGYYNDGFFYESFHINYDLAMFPLNSSTFHIDHPLIATQHYYNFKKNAFVNDTNQLDDFNLQQIQLYEQEK